MVQFWGTICHPALKYIEFGKIIRVLTNWINEVSCRGLFKKYKYYFYVHNTSILLHYA
jgi:hypothetical protein